MSGQPPFRIMLPSAIAPVVDPATGILTPEWLAFLSGLPKQVAVLTKAIEGIPAQSALLAMLLSDPL